LLNLTTIRRLAVLLFVFVAWTPAAYAWSWPVQGPVLRSFSYDESHPYASGQHRGIDIGADAVGETVVAPAAGTISFAGTVPTNGETVTIETADGYSVTLTHLGSIAVTKGATVAEQDAVGTVGPSGTPEVDGPYVHLGIRVTTDQNGYLDPLGLLPPVPAGGSSQSGTTGAQPIPSGAASAPPAKKPAPSAPPRPHATTTAHSRRDVSSHDHGRVQVPRGDAQSPRSAERPTSQEVRPPLEARTPRSHPSEEASSLRRPLDEPAGVGTVRPVGPGMPTAQPRSEASDSLLGLACNGAAALVAVGAALTAGRRCRRRRRHAIPVTVAQVLHLPRPVGERPHVSRAA
jgi:Peptidase family M23